MARRLTVVQGDRILRNSDLDVITRLSRTTRWRMEKVGEFPARRQISSGSVGWLMSEITTWLENRGLVVNDVRTAA
jgi:prophage regulatory protein